MHVNALSLTTCFIAGVATARAVTTIIDQKKIIKKQKAAHDETRAACRRMRIAYQDAMGVLCANDLHDEEARIAYNVRFDAIARQLKKQ